MVEYQVIPGETVALSDWDPQDTRLILDNREETEKETKDLVKRLENLQELLYAEHMHKILVVLQGMDTSGKDGVIRHVFDGVNPQGVKVANFKVPTAEELDRDYLWRVHKQVPGKGEIVIFNRSHYEDVLVVRVHELVPKEIWSRRYQQINEFEQMLKEEGTILIKLFLHISKDEQKERLMARLEDPSKQWKFNPGDLKERALWSKYVEAYEDVLSLTSTDHAPWYIVPSDRKWYRNYVISKLLVDQLLSLGMEYPRPMEDLTGINID